MYTLATLDHLRRRLGLAADDTAEDDRLLRALQAASAEVERLTGRRYCPRRATIAHDINLFQATELLLTADLLAITALTNGDGSALSAADYVTIPAEGDAPIGVIRLTGGRAFVWDETPLQAVEVSGIWGWHDRWSAAWIASADTTQDDPLAPGTTSLTVSDADGADSEAESPRFQVGQLLRIEDEYLWVLAVDSATNTLTVQRGAQGTTAAAHDQNTPIAVYRPPREVEMLVLRWAAWLYHEPDQREAQDIPLKLIRALEPLRRLAV